MCVCVCVCVCIPTYHMDSRLVYLNDVTIYKFNLMINEKVVVKIEKHI